MAKLIKPVKGKHKFIVGIDYGHGETSAAIFPIEWDTAAGLRDAKPEDIDLDIAAREKVIPSAICRTKDGLIIGEEAFEHLTDNNGIRLAFKQKPQSLDGEAELLMTDYMKAVYARIRESRTELTNDNHIVYIARPSGWVEEEAKELYRQMAINAGIPLGGLTSESRAAIFYSKSLVEGFAKEITKGAIVFDLGSSTLDFTYLSDTVKPIDYGYNLGASIIDNAILENMILSNPEVKEFADKYPEYIDALRYRARKFKETAYGRNPNFKTKVGFPLGNIISEEEPSYEDYADTYVKLRINNLDDLNKRLEETTGYISKLKEALVDFRNNHIAGKKIYCVFLTGGASRMNFIRPLIAECYSLPIDNVKIDSDNPSVTISRGIALLGATDAITSVLVEELQQQLPAILNIDKISEMLDFKIADSISKEAWKCVERTCNNWIRNGNTTDMDELKEWLQRDIKTFQKNQISTIVSKVLQSSVAENSEDVRKRMNEIISRYAPGREITKVGKIDIVDMAAIEKSLDGMSQTIAEICDSISHIVGDILWAALGVFLFGVFAAPYYVAKAIWQAFRDDSAKREDKAKRILKKEGDIQSKVRLEIESKLEDNKDFKSTVSSSMKNYFTRLIDYNLQQVKIPIE